MIDVKNINGEVRLSVPVSDSCIHSKGVMQEDYVLLSFCSDVLIDFQKGDYIEFDNERFSIVYVEKPQRTSEGGYSYEQKFHAPWEILRSRILFFDRQYAGEATWKMTHKPENFMSVVISNIKSAGLGDYTFEIDASLTDMKLVQFDSTNIIDALSLIAEAWKTEWWFTGNVIHLSKCEFGTPLKLSLYDELASVESDKSSDTAFATRLYVFGSTRNLPKDYRKDEVGTVINGIVEKRLLLPKGIPYIDAWENMAAKDVVEGVMVIDEVYPKRVGKLSTVTSKEYTETVEDQDGKEIKQTWNAYRYTDVELTFSDKYIIPGEKLKIIFQKGKLTGMEFAVKFNPDRLPESETGAQVFEIVRNEDYGIPLPSKDFAPAVNDEYILYGYDTKFVADTLVPMAEDELLRTGKKELEKLSIDKSVYTAQTNKVRCAGYKIIEGGKLSYNELDEINLEIGQSVLLDTNHLFGEGGRVSRIYSYEKKLNNIFDASYSIGESSRYSKSRELKAQLNELTYQNKQFAGNGSSSVYLIKKYDTTNPTDFNAYSALRARDEFLSKKRADTAHGHITFERGADFGANSEGIVDANGNFIGKSFSDKSFLQGLLGSGFSVYFDGQGHSCIDIDKLTVRMKAIFAELEIRKLKYVGGNFILGPAGMDCTKVIESKDYYRCFYQNKDKEGHLHQNEFRVGDLVRCQEFSPSEGKMVSNHFFWRKCVAVGEDYIDLSKTDMAVGSDVPLAGDTLVTLGNKIDKERQKAIIISSYGDAAPSIAQYDGINDYNLEGKAKTIISPNGNLFSGSFKFESDGIEKDVQTELETNASAIQQQQQSLKETQADATAARNRLNDWAADNKISPTEMLSIKEELQRVNSDWEQIVASCNKYEIEISSSDTSAKKEYTDALSYLLTLSETQTFNKDDYSRKQAAYYNVRTFLLKEIADKAKEYTYGQSAGNINLLLHSSEPLSGTNLSRRDKLITDWTTLEGETITISFFYNVKMHTGNDFRERVGLELKYDGGYFGVWKSFRKNSYISEQGRYIETVLVPNLGKWPRNEIFTYVQFINGIGEASIYDIKIELGNTATAWSPAPAYIRGNFEATNRKIEGVLRTSREYTNGRINDVNSRITQTSDKIEAEVSEREQLGKTVTENSAQIRINAEQISQRVTNGQMTSAIETSANSIVAKVSKNMSGQNLLPSDKSYWESGSFSEYFEPNSKYEDMKTESTTRIRSKGLIYIGQGVIDLYLTAKTGYEIGVMQFNGDRGFVGVNTWGGYMNGASYGIAPKNNCRYIVVVMRKTDDSAISVEEAETAMAKIEIGTSGTPFSPCPTQGTPLDLLETGIDIHEKKVTVTAESFSVRDNVGNPIAVFKIDANGMPVVKAENIDAENIRVDKLTTKSKNGKAKVVIEDGLISVFGAIAKNIEFGIRDGKAVMTYFNDDGVALYDLGPSGIEFFKGIQMIAVYYGRVSGTTDNSIGQGIINPVRATYYRYQQGNISMPNYNGKLYQGQGLTADNRPTSQIIPDGYYTNEFGTPGVEYLKKKPALMLQDQLFVAGNYHYRYVVYVSNGLPSVSAKAYW